MRYLQADTLPDYKRAFTQADYRGYLLLKDCNGTGWGKLFHACHLHEFERILRAGALPLRSRWELIHPEAGEWNGPCLWCGLNFFQGDDGNRYGPILFEFPLEVLEGQRLLVFRRVSERYRYFFIQYREEIPPLRRGGKVWHPLKQSAYFDTVDGGYGLKGSAIYDVVLTGEIPLDEHVRITAVHHSRCISTPGTCGNIPSHRTHKAILEIAEQPWVRRKYGKKLRTMIAGIDDVH